MGNRELLRAVLKLARTAVLVDAALLLVVGAICWIGGWRSVDDFANGVFWAGLAVMVIGAMSVVGGTDLARDGTYRYAQTAGHASASEGTRRGWQDLNESYGFLVRIGIVGITSIGLSELIKAIF